MRKIPEESDNPIDNFILKIVDPLCPLFKALHFTPNGITTISLVFGLLSAYLLYKGHPYLFGITFFISYFFDCMDGYYARKYNMVTRFGDIYDHVKDIVVILIILYIFLKRNYKCSPRLMIIFAIVLGIILLLMFAFIGCQEKIYRTDQSPALD